MITTEAGLLVPDQQLLTPRWTPLEPHSVQQLLWKSRARFKVVPAGRRSGKTELAKRNIVVKALEFDAAPHGRFVCGAPTRQQAKRIYWADLKAMIPKWALAPWTRHPISESELIIWLYNGARLEVVGMDAPERVEGDPLDGIVLDEYGNMVERAWGDHVRPALFTRGRPPGWAWLIGVPEGRNHYYKTYRKAVTGDDINWEAFTWKSIDILPAHEIEDARNELDPLTFAQEYEADFVTFAGRAYYQYDSRIHEEEGLAKQYDPHAPLIFCFDFNVKPGTAVVCQELEYEGTNGSFADMITAIIGEVWIPNNSTTPRVVERLLKEWGNHKGDIEVYGDPAGGQRGTAKINGSDWDLIKQMLHNHFGSERVTFDVTRSHPSERSRVNAVNSRLLSMSGVARMAIDPRRAAHTCEDLDGVRTNDKGQIDKKSDPMLTHLTDGLGYYIHRKYPVDGGRKLRSMLL